MQDAARPQDFAAIAQDLELGAALAAAHLVINSDCGREPPCAAVQGDGQQAARMRPEPVRVRPSRSSVSAWPSTDLSACGLPKPCVAFVRSSDDSQTASSARAGAAKSEAEGGQG